VDELCEKCGRPIAPAERAVWAAELANAENDLGEPIGRAAAAFYFHEVCWDDDPELTNAFREHRRGVLGDLRGYA
jgi:hypothetical protein